MDQVFGKSKQQKQLCGRNNGVLMAICPTKQAWDGFNAFLFLLAITVAQRRKLALAPLYLGSLYACSDEGVYSFSRSFSS